jgi:hypothetical protein
MYLMANTSVHFPWKPSTSLLLASAGSADAAIGYAMQRSWHQPAMRQPSAVAGGQMHDLSIYI